MTYKLPALAVVLSLVASSAVADMVVINGRYFVAKASVRGYFYNAGKASEKTVFDVRWNDWSTQYECEDKYDETRVEAAAMNLIIQLNEAMSLDFQDFLDGEGFKGCAKF